MEHTTQTGSIQQVDQKTEIPSVPADYIFIAILFFSLGVWLGSALVKAGAKSSRLIEQTVGAKPF